MVLAHDVIGEPASPKALVLAHGILGSRNNWRGFARRFVERTPGWCAVTVDLRNHGQSHGFPRPDTIAAAAADLRALLDMLACPEVALVGHSYGGKVVLDAARQDPRGVAQVWSLDSPLGIRSFDRGLEEIDRVLDAVRSVPVPLATRAELVTHLRGLGLSERLAQWMTTNLEARGEGLVWKFELDRIPDMLASFGETDLWPWVLSGEARPALFVVRGGKSDRWSPEELENLRNAGETGLLRSFVMPAAGHWLHTDDPEGLMAIMSPWLAPSTPASAP